MVVGSIPIEEWLEKQLALIPLLAEIAPIVATAIVGGVTALVTAFGIYLIDRADLFRVIRERQTNGVCELLDASIERREQYLQALFSDSPTLLLELQTGKDFLAQ